VAELITDWVYADWVMAGLISIIEDAGFSVFVETRDRKHQTLAKIHGAEIQFGVVEKVDRRRDCCSA
jgi:hypothetical protein